MVSRRAGLFNTLIIVTTALLLFVLPARASAFPHFQASDDPDELMRQAEELYDQEEYADALELFRQVAGIYSTLEDLMGEAGAIKMMARSLSALGKYEEAYQTYQQELALRLEIGDRKGEGVAYLNIGVNYSRWDNFTLAIEFTQKCLPLLEETGDDEGVLIGYLNLAYYLRHEDRYTEALEASQQALPLAQELEDRNREGSAWHGMGMANYHLDEYSLAAEAFSAAAQAKGEIGDTENQSENLLWAASMYLQAYNHELAIEIMEEWLENEFANDDLDLKAATLNDLGICYLRIGEYILAAETIESSLALKEQIGDREGQASGYGNLGAIYSATGDHQEALENFERAMELQHEFGDYEDEAKTLANIARVYMDLSTFDQAWSYFQQSLELRQEIGDREGEVDVLNGMGVINYDIGDMDQALQNYQDALDLSREIGYREGEMDSLQNIGTIYEANADYENAIATYEAALEANERIGDDRARSSLLNFLGLSYFKLGDLQSAENYYNQALRAARSTGDRGIEAFILTNLASLEVSSGSLDEALDHYFEALQLDREDNFRSGESTTLFLIGWLYEEKGDDDNAIDYYLASIEIREALRESIKLESFKSAVASEDADVYRRAIQLLIKLGRFEEAFDLTERSRARTFLDQMGNTIPDLRQGADAEFLAREEQLLNEITALENDMINGSTPFTGQRSDPSTEVFKARLAEKRQEYLDLLSEIQLANPKLASLVTISTLDVPSIQAVLDRDVTLLSYYVMEDSVVVFLVSNTAFEFVELPVSAESLQQAVENFRTLGLANLNNTHPLSLVELYEGLITPLLPQLNAVKIGIIPHQWLHFVPFAALSDGEEYLGEQYVLFEIPAASTLQFLGTSEIGQVANPLILGNPLTDNPDLADLEYAAQEANLVAELFDVEALTGAAASEAALQSQVGNANILHLAAHGSYDPTSPQFSRLWLAPEGETDGRLNVFEVYGLDLSQTDLVVLSACQTNLGELSAGDEIVGLNRAFLYGTPTVVSSLWSVDDEATGVLMQAFYENLIAGMGKAEALQLAQIELRNDADHPQWTHPYYWAAFVLSGDPGAEAGYLLKPAVGAELTRFVPVVIGILVFGVIVFFFLRGRRHDSTMAGGKESHARK